MRAFYVEHKSIAEIGRRFGVKQYALEKRLIVLRADLRDELGMPAQTGAGNELRVIRDEDYELHFSKLASDQIKKRDNKVPDISRASHELPFKNEGVLHISPQHFE